MNNNTHIELVTSVASGETVDITVLDSGSTYYHVYNALIVQGSATSTVSLILNGNAMDLAGGTVLRYPIRTLTVSSGTGVVLTGYKQSKEIFGN